MSFSKPLFILAAALAAITASVAAPTSIPSGNTIAKRITPDTQGCSVQDNVFFLSYSVDIGVTYADGDGCDNVLHAIQSQGVAVSNWQCVDDGDGGTQLWFNTANGFNTGDSINVALTAMYPMVNGFNCPNA